MPAIKPATLPAKGPKLNRAYYKAFISAIRFLVLKGGAGSGKSVFCAQKILHRCKTEHYTISPKGEKIPYTFAHKFLVMRKVANTLRLSVFALLKSEIERQGLVDEWKIFEGRLSFLHIPTGAQIVLTGVDDVEKLKSINDITGTWLEEATEFTEADFNQINLRLRGLYPFYKQHLISFNPISASHWLKGRFDTKRGKDGNINPHLAKTELYHTNYKHNDFLDADYIEELNNLVNVDENLARIYLDGNWGIEDVNKLFARNFVKKRHVSRRAVYNPAIGQIWLSFDFNIVNTCLVFQYTETSIYLLKEYRFDGDLQDLVYTVRTDLKEIKAEALGYANPQEVEEDIYIINGDASGGNRSGLTVDRASAYTQLAKFFADRNGNPYAWDYFNVPEANPAHASSRLVTNMVLKNEQDFLIHPDCECTINDLENVLFENGSIDKSDASLTHCLDAFRYFIWAELAGRLENYGLRPIADKLTGQIKNLIKDSVNFSMYQQ